MHRVRDKVVHSEDVTVRPRFAGCSCGTTVAGVVVRNDVDAQAQAHVKQLVTHDAQVCGVAVAEQDGVGCVWICKAGVW